MTLKAFDSLNILIGFKNDLKLENYINYYEKLDQIGLKYCDCN